MQTTHSSDTNLQQFTSPLALLSLEESQRVLRLLGAVGGGCIKEVAGTRMSLGHGLEGAVTYFSTFVVSSA